MYKPVLKKMRMAVIASIAVILLGAVSVHYFIAQDAIEPEWPFPMNAATEAAAAKHSVVSPSQTAPAQKVAAEKGLPTALKNTSQSFEERLVNELKKRYGATISVKSTQVMLFKVKRFILNLYPTDGDTRFLSILRKAFPKWADEIIATLAQWETYKRWEEDNSDRLAAMNDLEKQGELWRQRRALFGKDAKDIWSEDVLAFEQRKKNMRKTIASLEHSQDTTLDEKLDIYKDTLAKTYEDSPEAYVLYNKAMLTKVFFGLGSVQDKLMRMTPDQRQDEINHIRSQMGYSEEQIEKLADLDNRRDQRWSNGLAYMTAREKIIQDYDESEQADQLKKLREKYFKHEARTIALEEQDGFFRYSRHRVYGRN